MPSGAEIVTMSAMAKKRKPPEPDEQPGNVPLSRKNTRYLAVPADLYDRLDKYRASKSDEDDDKSMSWAARHALRRFLESVGF